MAKYSREDLKDCQFGPFEVKICDVVVVLSDGVKLSAKIWFPGSGSIEGAINVAKYCDASQDHAEDEVCQTFYLKMAKQSYFTFILGKVPRSYGIPALL